MPTLETGTASSFRSGVDCCSVAPCKLTQSADAGTADSSAMRDNSLVPAVRAACERGQVDGGPPLISDIEMFPTPCSMPRSHALYPPAIVMTQADANPNTATDIGPGSVKCQMPVATPGLQNGPQPPIDTAAKVLLVSRHSVEMATHSVRLRPNGSNPDPTGS